MKDIVPLAQASFKSAYGGKAANLSKLLSAKLPVPSGFVIGIHAFAEGSLTPQAQKKVRTLLHASKKYAVRSSAVGEDAKHTSWAGQFETFLNVKSSSALGAIEKCHSSTKARAEAYAKKMREGGGFRIAVVVQEMLVPEYAGVLFTRNPVTGAKESVIEYVKGIGEKLVGGKVDPKRIVVKKDTAGKAPFDVKKLISLSQKVEKVFGAPQDIEFAVQNGKVWLLQARPITTLAAQDEFDIGEPSELFYWGPSRTEPLYMSDFTVACGRVFAAQHHDPQWPNPPKTVVLFHDHQVVWLINSKEFNTYAAGSFKAYLRYRSVAKDAEQWASRCKKLDRVATTKRNVFDVIVSAWEKTIHAEFSLYGAEIVIGRMLGRLAKHDRQRAWQEFTLFETPSFLQRIDNEILAGESTKNLAQKYPWIRDGYFGVVGNAKEYFDTRCAEIKGGAPTKIGNRAKRRELARKLHLTKQEVRTLNLARDLAKFMDDRKAWMMRTRKYLKTLKKNPGPAHGWMYADGSSGLFGEKRTEQLWKKYIDYKAVSGDLKGVVASKGGEDIVEGEVVVLDSPNTAVATQRILVVPSTSPSYVPLMRSSKALITNHGGMMSHAAIVAREFELPCIVGTKTATKQLRSGDRVALDLVSGAIRRIS